MLDVRIMDVGFNVAVGVGDSVLLYASDDDDTDISVLLSLVSFTVLDFWISSHILFDVP
jgi:hypothetical protein